MLQKIENYNSALAQLEQAVAIYQKSQQAASSPRAVLKDAYAAGVIQDAERWNRILTARNITSHVYDEKTADGVAAQICNDFLPVLQALGRFYRDE